MKGSDILSTYKIVSDTASDIFPSVIDYATMPRVPFYVTFDKEHYQKEMAELSVDDFYNHIPSTISQILAFPIWVAL